jgi:hypothetical protein
MRSIGKMAIYHFSVKAVQRSKGHSAVAGAAYRAAVRLVDHQTGQVQDYTKKRGVGIAELVMPDGCDWRPTREELWNAAEAGETRRDGTPAREHEVAIPSELSARLMVELVRGYAHDLARRHGCAVDFAIHAPSRKGDNRNWHAHVYQTTRKVDGAGLGGKCDREKAGRKRSADLEFERERWAKFCNRGLELAGVAARVDHRSHADRGIDAMPGEHDGVAVTGIKRRGGVSYVQQRRDVEKQEQQAARQAAKAAQVEVDALMRELEAARAELDAERAAGVPDRFIVSLDTLRELAKPNPKPIPPRRGRSDFEI